MARLTRTQKRAPLGSGQRFRQLEGELSQRKGVRDPAALAAFIGRGKFGKTRFSRLSAAGHRQ